MPLYTLADRSASAKAGGTTAAAQSVKRRHPTSGYAVRIEILEGLRDRLDVSGLAEERKPV